MAGKPKIQNGLQFKTVDDLTGLATDLFSRKYYQYGAHGKIDAFEKTARAIYSGDYSVTGSRGTAKYSAEGILKNYRGKTDEEKVKWYLKNYTDLSKSQIDTILKKGTSTSQNKFNSTLVQINNQERALNLLESRTAGRRVASPIPGRPSKTEYFNPASGVNIRKKITYGMQGLFDTKSYGRTHSLANTWNYGAYARRRFNDASESLVSFYDLYQQSGISELINRDIKKLEKQAIAKHNSGLSPIAKIYKVSELGAGEQVNLEKAIKNSSAHKALDAQTELLRTFGKHQMTLGRANLMPWEANQVRLLNNALSTASPAMQKKIRKQLAHINFGKGPVSPAMFMRGAYTPGSSASHRNGWTGKPFPFLKKLGNNGVLQKYRAFTGGVGGLSPIVPNVAEGINGFNAVYSGGIVPPTFARPPPSSPVIYTPLPPQAAFGSTYSSIPTNARPVSPLSNWKAWPYFIEQMLKRHSSVANSAYSASGVASPYGTTHNAFSNFASDSWWLNSGQSFPDMLTHGLKGAFWNNLVRPAGFGIGELGKLLLHPFKSLSPTGIVGNTSNFLEKTPESVRNMLGLPSSQMFHNLTHPFANAYSTAKKFIAGNASFQDVKESMPPVEQVHDAFKAITDNFAKSPAGIALKMIGGALPIIAKPIMNISKVLGQMASEAGKATASAMSSAGALIGNPFTEETLNGITDMGGAVVGLGASTFTGIGGLLSGTGEGIGRLANDSVAGANNANAAEAAAPNNGGGKLGKIGGVANIASAALGMAGGFISAGGQAISGGWSSALNLLKSLNKTALKILATSPLFETIKNILNLAYTMAFLPAMTLLEGNMMPTITKVLDWAVGFGNQFASAFSKYVQPITEQFNNAFGDVMSFLKNNMGNIAEFIAGIISMLPTMIEMQKGFIELFVNNKDKIIDVADGVIHAMQTVFSDRVFKSMLQMMDLSVYLLENYGETLVRTSLTISKWLIGQMTSIAAALDVIADIGDFLHGDASLSDIGHSLIDSLVSGFLGIFGVHLATGGYVPATPGGVPAIIGEGGEGEYVIPESKLGNIGSGITINFNSPVYGQSDFKKVVKDIINEASTRAMYR